MKEKFDLSLDSRQIVSLLVAGIVVLGSVFVLGVVVGKKLATQERAVGGDLLTALDEKAKAMDEVRDASLTFQEELTRNGPPSIDPPTIKVVEAPEPAAAPPPVVAEAPAPKPEPVAVAPKPEPVRSPDPAPARPAGKVSETPVATRTAPGHDGGSGAKRPLEAAPNGAFTLQLSASQNKTEADRFATRLRDRGYAPFIVEATVPGKGTWYRVRMGSFASKEAATRYLQDFRRETQLDAFVASTTAPQ